MGSNNGLFRGIKKVYRKEDLAGKIILICFSLFVIICLCSVPIIFLSLKSSPRPTNTEISTLIPTLTIFYPIVPGIIENITPTIIAIIPTDKFTETTLFFLNSSSTPLPILLSSLTPSPNSYQTSTFTITPNGIVSSTTTVTAIPIPHAGCIIHGAYPDPYCTPGAIFNVTKDQICIAGYSSTVRNVSDSEKAQVFADYGIISHTSGQYEIDHFISLELGGSNEITNLWPEPANPVPGFHEKDKVENYLHRQVCSGALSLAQAQTLERTDWVGVYYSLGLPLNTPIPTIPQVHPSETQPGLPTSTSSGHPIGSTGQCVDGSYTKAQHKQGACSHHGGVQEWWGP